MAYETRIVSDEEYHFMSDVLKMRGLIPCALCCFNDNLNEDVACYTSREKAGVIGPCDARSYFVRIENESGTGAI